MCDDIKLNVSETLQISWQKEKENSNQAIAGWSYITPMLNLAEYKIFKFFCLTGFK